MPGKLKHSKGVINSRRIPNDKEDLGKMYIPAG
jgi:hypothetical protein